MNRLVIAFGLICAGCRGSSTSVGVDMAGHPASGDMAGAATSGDMAGQLANGDMAMATKSYTKSMVATMRQGKSGDYELDNVVSLAVTPSKESPRLFVQDAAGGPYSAMMTRCSSKSTKHPCTVSSMVAGIASGHSVTLQGTFITENKGVLVENFYIDTITDNGAAPTVPTVTRLQLADIERSSMKADSWYQKVTVNLSDTLQMYDWTPPEFSYADTKCPYQFGFGMIPGSVLGGMGDGGTGDGGGPMAAPSCMNATSQPAGQTMVNPSEVLIGTDFYKGFTVSSDCRCAAMYQDKEPTVASTLAGTVTAIFIYDTVYMTTNGYQYLAPLLDSDAAITNTM